MQTCALSKLAALIADRDLGPEAIACAEVPGGTEPPASPAQPPEEQGSPGGPVSYGPVS